MTMTNGTPPYAEYKSRRFSLLDVVYMAHAYSSMHAVRFLSLLAFPGPNAWGYPHARARWARLPRCHPHHRWGRGVPPMPPPYPPPHATLPALLPRPPPPIFVLMFFVVGGSGCEGRNFRKKVAASRRASNSACASAYGKLIGLQFGAYSLGATVSRTTDLGTGSALTSPRRQIIEDPSTASVV